MMLLMDVGHSRVKLGRSMEDGSVSRLGAFPLADRDSLYESLLNERAQADELRAVSTWQGEPQQEISAKVEAVWGSPVHWVDSRAARGDIALNYEDPATFGADRLLALQAARRRTQGPCVVVDAGTALTVDAVTQAGQHCGGWIVPGYHRLVQDMGELLPLNSKPAAESSDLSFTSTAHAVEAGAWKILAAGVDLMAEQCGATLSQQAEGEVRVFVTGGDAKQLCDWCRIEMTRVPDLVLEGLLLQA